MYNFYYFAQGIHLFVLQIRIAHPFEGGPLFQAFPYRLPGLSLQITRPFPIDYQAVLSNMYGLYKKNISICCYFRFLHKAGSANLFEIRCARRTRSEIAAVYLQISSLIVPQAHLQSSTESFAMISRDAHARACNTSVMSAPTFV